MERPRKTLRVSIKTFKDARDDMNHPIRWIVEDEGFDTVEVLPNNRGVRFSKKEQEDE